MRNPLTRKQALAVKVGDELRIDTLWNKTEPPRNKILSPVKVLDIRAGGSQTGVMFTVATMSGKNVELDAGWFRQ